MMLCIAAAGAVAALATGGFTLDWTHTVERTRWHERWAVTAAGLALTGASVQGSGAGMEVPEGAVHRDGAWHWRPALPPQRELVLAASGTGAWRLCWDGGCRLLGARSGEPVRLWAAPSCTG